MAETTFPIRPIKRVTGVAAIRANKHWQRRIRRILSYAALLFGASLMLFPLLWMLSASLKEPWQIFSSPIEWIPQKWEEVPAGTTGQTLNLWTVQRNGQEQQVVTIGTRRYTNVLDAALLTALQTIPTDQLSAAVPQAVQIAGESITLNLRTDKAGKQVIALAKDGDNTVVATLDAVRGAIARLPLDVVNAGERDTFKVGATELKGRAVTTNGTKRQLLPIGPESELTVVAPPGMLAGVGFVPVGSLTAGGFAKVGGTEVKLYKVANDPTTYISISGGTWQPIINQEEVSAAAFVAQAAQLKEPASRVVQGIALPTAKFTAENGAPVDVLVLLGGTGESLVMPLDKAGSVRLARIGDLSTVRGDTFKGTPVRVQDGYSERGDVHTVMVVSEPRDMALIVPQAAVTDAFDVNPATLQRATHTALRFQGYREALQTKVGETYFTSFFRNSFALVLLNTLGHLFSCILVAYAFARLRAPGKGILFLILLSTMMLPFPVTLVPIYEIFRDLSAVNTLWPLFIRSFFGNAFLIFMLRQFFASIPRELEEAARMDGANIVQIIARVVIPLSRPAIATVVIFTFWWTWNSFFEPFIYLSSPDLFPVSVGLNFFRDQYGTIFYDRMISASVLSMLPLLLIFLFAQRYFIEGIQLTGLKG